METLAAIYKRRAVRSYTAERINSQIIQTLLESAVQAPSAMNSQPWGFVVIQDENLLKRYSDEAKIHLLKLQAESASLNVYLKWLEDPNYNIFYDANTLIVFCAKQGGFDSSGDCHLAAQNLMLAACSLCLGTCPIGFARDVLNEPKNKKELEIPENYSVVLPIIVGYPNGETPPVKRKKPEILKWIHKND